MKTKTILLVLLLGIGIAGVRAQQTSGKLRRAAHKTELRKQIDSLVKSNHFVFIAYKALPQGYEAVDLTTNSNHLIIDTAMIESYMPYFGRAYGGIIYGGDGGIKFTGKPREFSVAKTKRGYEVKAKVKEQQDFFDLLLTIGPEGRASLTVTSINRSPITYFGYIETVQKAEKTVK